MSRKKQAPKRNIIADSRYSSATISKFINAVMYHGKRSTAEKIYTKQDGLQLDNIETMVFDHDGFLWLGGF